VILATIWWWCKLRERLAVNKQRQQRFHMERFNLRKLNEVEGKEQYHVGVSNRFSAVEYFGNGKCRENINISAK
jgi:hypothetical protein